MPLSGDDLSCSKVSLVAAKRPFADVLQFEGSPKGRFHLEANILGQRDRGHQ